MNTTLKSDEIARRAYEIYEREGRQDGRDFDHWVRAEAELRGEQPPNGNSAPAATEETRETLEINRLQGQGSNGKGKAKRPARPTTSAARN